ncbi:MAG: penicillin-binding protein 2 [Planctomycetes bacterium]|nr:penicillin-binding protein 2 [Planctomycetota bacterium]
MLPHLKRANIFFAGLAVVFAVLAIRLGYIQIYQHSKYRAIQVSQAYLKVDTTPENGMILDRNGKILALSRLVDSVYLVPKDLDNHPTEIKQLASLLGLKPAELAAKISKAVADDKLFLWVKRKIDDETSKKVIALNIKGIGTKKEYKRFYPEGTLACHLIGYRGMDSQALDGMELYADNYLKGEAGYEFLNRDGRRRLFVSDLPKKPAQPGQNVYLTIDINIQHIAEKNLRELCKKYQPNRAEALVMNPATGEILALAQLPAFDPAEYQKYSEKVRHCNIFTDAYEPGSTFKPFVIAAALERGVCTTKDKFFCENGKYKMGKRTITDHKPYGWLTLPEVVMQSSNVGMTKIGSQTPKESLYGMIKRFGFAGTRSGLDIPGEHPGLITSLNKWSNYTTGSVAMGYEVSVNSFQLIRAYSAFANNGYLVQPKLLKEVIDRDNKTVYKNEIQPLTNQIISPELSKQVSTILRGVVLSGTGTAANLKTYAVAGKTGTARKLDANGRYSTQKYRSLFVAFAPVEHPDIAVLVLVDEPKGQYYASTVAAPTAGVIIDETLKYLKTPTRVANTR